MRAPFATVLLGIALALSAANLALFFFLLDTRSKVAEAAAGAAEIVRQAQEGSLPSPITARIAIDDTFSIPVDTVVPINTSVTVPVTIPILGQVVSVTVPIKTDVPLRTTIRVPVHASVPVSVSIGELPIGNALAELEAWLLRLSTGR